MELASEDSLPMASVSYLATKRRNFAELALYANFDEKNSRESDFVCIARSAVGAE
jgi:hypothetical protein